LTGRTTGLEITTEPIAQGRDGTTRVILGLSDVAFQDVFRALCEDFAAAFAGLSNVHQAGKEFAKRFNRWKRFLQAHGAGGLSDSECLGLVGELSVLRQLLSGGPDPAVALRAWTGPDRDSRDFTLARGDLEVKTTASLAPTELKISSLQQLDTRAGRSLAIQHVVVSRNPTVGQTLPELVEEVARLSGDAIALFRDRLLSAGYLDAHEPRYSSPRYQLIVSEAFAVEDGFPRLVSNHVPRGINDATYSVSLAAIRDFRIDAFDPQDLLTEDVG
ncbi:MAG: PD-(D/E)XK motif protein, partial [Longimicrobiales bacterium]